MISKRLELMKVPMTADGLPVWEPATRTQSLLRSFMFSSAILVTFLTIFGIDLLITAESDDADLRKLLIFLTCYLLAEFVICCVLVRGYPISIFWFMDLLVLTAIAASMVQYCGFITQSFSWQFFRYSMRNLSLLRWSKLAGFGTRMSMYFRITSNSAHGYMERFGLKGYEDDFHLHQYIQEKFTDAFFESEDQGRVSRDDFTMMLRSDLNLELELEEEDVLYRVMTVFGRSQQIKAMEEQLKQNELKPHSLEMTQIQNKTSSDKAPKVVAFPFPARKASMKRSLSDFAASPLTFGQLPHSKSFRINRYSEDEKVSNLRLLRLNRLSHDETTKRKMAWRRNSTGKPLKLKKFGSFMNPTNFFWKPTQDGVEVLPEPLASLEGIQNMDVRKPLQTFRISIATALLPLENYSLQWALQLFRKLESLESPPSTPETFFGGQKKPNEALSLAEFNSRITKMLLIDGNEIYLTWTKFDTRQDSLKAEHELSTLKPTPSVFGSLFRGRSSTREEGSSFISSSVDDLGITQQRAPLRRSRSKSHEEFTLLKTQRSLMTTQNSKETKDKSRNLRKHRSLVPLEHDHRIRHAPLRNSDSPKSSMVTPSASPSSSSRRSMPMSPKIRASQFFSRKSSSKVLPDSTEDDVSFKSRVIKIVSPQQKAELSKVWIARVVNKVKSQMREHMRLDIIKDSSFGDQEGVAEHIGRGSTRAHLIAILIAFLVGPFLLLPTENRCEQTNSPISFNMIRGYARELGNSSREELLTSTSCSKVQTDPHLQSMVNDYRAQDSPPYLLRVDGCTLYSNPNLVAYSKEENVTAKHSSRLQSSQVSYLPCTIDTWTTSRHKAESFDTVAAFDMRQLLLFEAHNSLLFRFLMLILLFGMSVFVANDVAKVTEIIQSPLGELARDMNRVSRFDLSKRRRNTDTVVVDHNYTQIAEVKSIEDSFTTMRTALQSFAKYVPQDVVQQLVRAKAGMAKLAVEEQEVTVLFSDIENFTKICESLGVGDKLLNLMSDYFTAMSEIITSTGGCLLEFIGDAVLAVWNAPHLEEMHAVRAVTAALEMHSYLASMAGEWDAKGYPRVRIRCGIHTAKVLVGNIGAPNRMKYGVLGDGVNTASRLEETNKRYGTRTLISANTFKEVNRQVNNHKNLQHQNRDNGPCLNYKGFFQSRAVDRVVFKGKTAATTLYEVVDFMHEKDKSSIFESESEISDSCDLSAQGMKLALDTKKALESIGSYWPQNNHPPESKGSLKELMLETHNVAWDCFLKSEFRVAHQLFTLVNDIQTELGPRTKASGLPDDFCDEYYGDKAAVLLRDRCATMMASAPPKHWDGIEVLTDKHF